MSKSVHRGPLRGAPRVPDHYDPLPVNFDARQRERYLERLASEPFDLLVIGGGITGAGVALDAAGRGLRTALVERGDFAAGTSSRSSKLVHGGLRYLQQKEFRLVYEALAERQRLLRLAPHLVKPLPFLIPVFASGVAGQAKARAYARGVGTALWMYDATGGARIGKLHKRLSKREALELMPDLDGRRLAAGFLYYDARVDDARLTLTVAKTAASLGAVTVNRVEATGLLRESGRVGGAVLSDRLTGRQIEARAAVVVNAAGVWADELRAMDEGTNPRSIRPAKGVHITLPAGRPALDIAAVLSVPGDKRSVFVIPWGDRIYVGTTDTDYDGPLDDPQCTAADVEYLLGALNAWLTKPVGRHEVLGAWAGLRPLVGGPSPASGGRAAAASKTTDLSRRHAVRVAPSGLVTIVGGKLTTYRAMAEDTVDEAVTVMRQHRSAAGGERRAGRLRVPDSRSGSTPLFGADGYDELLQDGAAERLGLPQEVVSHLAGRFGGHAGAVAAMVRDRPELGERLVPGLPYLKAEAVYAVRYEMALTLEDVLSRRTRALLLDAAATAGAAPSVADLMAQELGWSDDERSRQVETFLALVERQRRAADPAEDAVEARMLYPTGTGSGTAGSGADPGWVPPTPGAEA
ncbi:MAG TPA: glycerol-3-phosphate dehydrogenase/oxidase [Acidimicrobiia bacterium]|nr:glycerol-3-phosphate dehydrogenase/oxidase [Acidimicrobiia bacterium]